MSGTRCNLEKDRATKGCEVMGIFVPKCSQNHRKGYFSNDRDEGELLCTLQGLGPSKPEFYGECNGSEYNLIQYRSI